MGAGRWDPSAYATYASTTVGKSTADIFTTRGGAKEHLSPKGVTVRESRDSSFNPSSTALIVGIDVTGSMGMLADKLAREGLGTLFTEVLDRKPISDPHIMFMAIGDANCDRAPLQVSQFEADSRIIEQLADIWIEQGGGGNSFESYNLAWYFAAMHTSIDCFEKRGKKGYLFTVGDENAPNDLTRDQIEEFIGDKLQTDLPNAELLAAVQRMYHVFHVIVAQGGHARTHGVDSVRSTWSNLIGQRTIVLEDYTKLSEVIVSAIQVTEGADKEAVAKSWSGDTSLVVSRALSSLELAANELSSSVRRF